MFKNIKLKRSVYATEEHELLQKTTQHFIEKEIAPYHAQWEEDSMVSREVWLKAGETGLLCLDVPEQYGGAGLDFSFCALITEEILKAGYSGPGFFLHSDIVAPYIVDYGTEEQKKKWLPKMCTGEVITAIGMTEPSCGSDLQALKTTAEDRGDHYLVNGQKTFITNGYMSDLAIIAARTIVDGEFIGISLFLIEADRAGFSKGKPFKKVGMKAQDTCELFFDNVEIPKDNLLGEIGKGFVYMMQKLGRERLSVALMAVGGAEGALENTIVYTTSREAFKQPVAAFQNTQFKLAELATQLQIHQTFVDRCVELYCNKELSAETASMAKYSCTDMHQHVVDECVQLHGGYGYMWEYYIARAYADNRVARIYAGTNEIMKLLISRGLLREMHEANKRAAKK
ncbi:MAG TPA: acyl-CoA dehydrogenase family protein [Chitinophagales bacterium]|nr:acyl-CoA dehydrogenase family protein [Chitinophagales bacterium]MCB9075499.1 acyl-CoA dehydrogenase family protein [Chitinophagales bacterium]HMU98367.1 acyl-CoA dehydrogenase family protein [Chitinophagales bacterium]HMV03280.1 acyl-CoA dehydrogenase family protein [Chitinophagales bacterium]HMW93251.1 acyl-CoA dehydrogenase family protein [Chitinophagales bacterium]